MGMAARAGGIYLSLIHILKKRIPNAIEDMCIFPDTQEAIVSQAQWDRVQELRKNKRRPTKAQRQGMFSGLLFCPDCGNKPVSYTHLDVYKRQAKVNTAT